MNWQKAARAARLGNGLLSLVAGLMCLILILYGGYSLWDTFRIGRNAFASETLLKYKPKAGEEAGFDELRALNPDVAAWITLDDTHIDYPVVQGADDMEYINQDVYGEFSLSGTIFLSCLNSRDFSDSYSLLYGHHMENGSMFGDVTKFTEETYFTEHREGTLYLPEAAWKLHIFACVSTDAYDSVVYACGETADREKLLSYIREHAVQYREESGQGPILGLSTCADEEETNGRVIVFGFLEKPKEV